MLIRELLLADDAAIAADSEVALQKLIDRQSEAHYLFMLTISVKKTEVVGQGTNSVPEIGLGGETLKKKQRNLFTWDQPYLPSYL